MKEPVVFLSNHLFSARKRPRAENDAVAPDFAESRSQVNRVVQQPARTHSSKIPET